jgi:hypothetical protein
MAEKFDYARTVATANRLITRFGADAVVRVSVKGGDKWDPSETTTDYECQAVVVDYTARERANSSIELRDKHAFIAVAGLEDVDPTSMTSLVHDDIEYQMVTCAPLKPGDTLILFDAQVRA